MADRKHLSKTALRQGLVEQIRRPVAAMTPLSAQELHCLGHDPEDERKPIGLHDSAEPIGD